MKNLMVRVVAISLILGVAFIRPLFSQEQKSYDELKSFSKWNFTTGPVLYDKAKLTPQYGDLTFENKPMLGFNVGVLYDFHPEMKWSFQTGLIVAKEPISSISFKISHNDLYENYPGDLINEYKSYALYSFSFPLSLRFNLQTGKKHSRLFQLG